MVRGSTSRTRVTRVFALVQTSVDCFALRFAEKTFVYETLGRADVWRFLALDSVCFWVRVCASGAVLLRIPKTKPMSFQMPSLSDKSHIGLSWRFCSYSTSRKILRHPRLEQGTLREGLGLGAWPGPPFTIVHHAGLALPCTSTVPALRCFGAVDPPGWGAQCVFCFGLGIVCHGTSRMSIELEECQNLNLQHRMNHLKMSMFSVIFDCKPEGITYLYIFFFDQVQRARFLRRSFLLPASGGVLEIKVRCCFRWFRVPHVPWLFRRFWSGFRCWFRLLFLFPFLQGLLGDAKPWPQRCQIYKLCKYHVRLVC